MNSELTVGKAPGAVRDTAVVPARGGGRLIATGLALLGSLALAAMPVRADVGSSPAKTTAARSAVGNDDLQNSPTIHVQLVKGKRKTMLVVHGLVTANVQNFDVLAIGATANGIAMEPTYLNDDPRISLTGCMGFCTVSGTWWLDLDLAEKAHPGMFANAPINVALQGQTFGSTYQYKMSVMATLTKK